jgi:inorganic pyrophosphatase/exopolyphosphatase
MIASLKIQHFLSLILCALFFNVADAGMLGSIESKTDASLRQKKLDHVKAISSQELVAQQLKKFGLSNSEVEARLEKLSVDQLDALATRLEEVMAGQQTYNEEPVYKRMGFWVLWAVVIALIIIVFLGIGRNVGEVP